MTDEIKKVWVKLPCQGGCDADLSDKLHYAIGRQHWCFQCIIKLMAQQQATQEKKVGE